MRPLSAAQLKGGAITAKWLAFEPDEPRAVRAAKLDEALAIYTGVLAGPEGPDWVAELRRRISAGPPSLTVG